MKRYRRDCWRTPTSKAPQPSHHAFASCCCSAAKAQILQYYLYLFQEPLAAVPHIQILKNDEKWKNLEAKGLRGCTFSTVLSYLSYQATGEKRFTIVSSCNRSQLLLQRPQRRISEIKSQEFEKVVSCVCARVRFKFDQAARRQKQLGASNSSQAFATEII